MMDSAVFNETTFIGICNQLALADQDLQAIVSQYGYPPMWQRPLCFETLVHIILEQQVSLASALAALNKLKEAITDITPVNILSLSNEQLKSCYLSRQKIVYVQHLASEILSGKLKLERLSALNNEEVRTTLTKIKGIGNWSVDVFLMMVLQRGAIFPIGDVALLTSVKESKGLVKQTSKEAILLIAQNWAPHQTAAAFILWHGYLERRKK